MSVVDHYVKMHSFLQYPGRFPSAQTMREAVNLATVHRMKAEIVGKWRYCYVDDLVGVQLLSLGFWYSKKHGAYVFSGDSKQPVADDETLDEIKARLGCVSLYKKTA